MDNDGCALALFAVLFVIGLAIWGAAEFLLPEVPIGNNVSVTAQGLADKPAPGKIGEDWNVYILGSGQVASGIVDVSDPQVRDVLIPCDEAMMVGNHSCNVKAEKIDLLDEGFMMLLCGGAMAVLGAIPLALIAFGSWR